MEPELVGKRVMKLMNKHTIKIKELAKKMELTVTTLKNKLDGREEFYLDEMIKIKNIFQLDRKACDELFFKEETEIQKIRKK